MITLYINLNKYDTNIKFNNISKRNLLLKQRTPHMIINKASPIAFANMLLNHKYQTNVRIFSLLKIYEFKKRLDIAASE